MTASVVDTQVDRARGLLKSAARAAEQLESDVRELVSMRAWEVLGYENFSEMWEKENGYRTPWYATTLAVLSLPELDAGEVARCVGGIRPTTVEKARKQVAHGVPADKAHLALGSVALDRYIAIHGTEPVRKRPQPRRPGKAPDELVHESMTLLRRDADAIGDIAREADVPKAEIYRVAVAEFLMRYRESREATT